MNLNEYQQKYFSGMKISEECLPFFEEFGISEDLYQKQLIANEDDTPHEIYKELADLNNHNINSFLLSNPSVPDKIKIKIYARNLQTI